MFDLLRFGSFPNMKARQLIVSIALTFVSTPSLATRPSSKLQAYAFKDLRLIKIARSGKGMAACFATPDGKFIWAGKSYQLGNAFGRIAAVAAHHVLVEQGVELNGGQFAMSYLKWPVADGMMDLAKQCGEPPLH
jgi:hypothetical protein